LTLRPPTDDPLEEWVETLRVESVPPIWKNRTTTDGKTTVYACRSFTCSPPKHDIGEAIEWAKSDA
ncbi:MAG: hypothetical protein V5A36_02645, partial [Natronomonas sp.]